MTRRGVLALLPAGALTASLATGGPRPEARPPEAEEAREGEHVFGEGIFEDGVFA